VARQQSPARRREFPREELWDLFKGLLGTAAVIGLIVWGALADSTPKNPATPNFVSTPASIHAPSTSDHRASVYGANSTTAYNGGSGSTVICADGWVSHSGGIQGACSWHGGIAGGSSFSSPLLRSSTSSSIPTLDISRIGAFDTSPSAGGGYATVCSDGWMSHSGGIQGACSSHGGVVGP
jgi:hypothetical protein